MTQKNILVTGAGGGLGAALVDDLLTHGYNVLCQYRSQYDELLAVLRQHNKTLKEQFWCDSLEDISHVHDMQLRIEERLGDQKLYAVINLAGASSNAMCWKMRAEEFMRIINANLTSTFNVCNTFIPMMRDQGFGRIINTSSVVAHAGTIGASHYCAAKSGIEGLTRAMALELANKNITVNALGLGYFDRGLIKGLSPELQESIKEKTPLKRFGTPSELAGIVRFLLSDESTFITGQVIGVNGGYDL